MIEEGLSRRASGKRYIKPRDFGFAFGVAVFAAALHTIALALELFRAAESHALTASTVTRVLILIELCLLVTVAGLWARRVAWMWLTSAALIAACAGYAWWYAYSRQVLALLLSQSFYQTHAEAVPTHHFGLIGATWLNLMVFMTSGVLLVWVVKTLRGMPRGCVAKIIFKRGSSSNASR
ncbi:MAG: hypothetical protein DMF67_16510 [Acidobacteria bacterium]|nr:MAG: hypothetical protein DMF67_16510 [Acidobacteriota bacterium]